MIEAISDRQKKSLTLGFPLPSGPKCGAAARAASVALRDEPVVVTLIPHEKDALFWAKARIEPSSPHNWWGQLSVLITDL